MDGWTKERPRLVGAVSFVVEIHFIRAFNYSCRQALVQKKNYRILLP